MKRSTDLVVKRSKLPGSGKGLFTKVFIPKHSKIAEYKGKITSWKDVEHDQGMNPYIFYVNRNHVINAKNDKTSVARYANDAKGLNRLKNLKNNSAYTVEHKKVFIEALTDIPPGAEILVGYGKEYWDVIKKNSKRSQKK